MRVKYFRKSRVEDLSRLMHYKRRLTLELEGYLFNHTGCSAKFKNPTSLSGSRWPSGQNMEIGSYLREFPHDSGPKLVVGQPSTRQVVVQVKRTMRRRDFRRKLYVRFPKKCYSKTKQTMKYFFLKNFLHELKITEIDDTREENIR